MVRGQKAAARGRRTAEILRQNAIPFLFGLADRVGPEAPTQVARSIRSDPKYAVALAKRLASSGLAEIHATGRVAGRLTYRVSITQRGREVVRLLEPVITLLE